MTYTINTPYGIHEFDDYLTAKGFIDSYAWLVPANDNADTVGIRPEVTEQLRGIATLFNEVMP